MDWAYQKKILLDKNFMSYIRKVKIECLTNRQVDKFELVKGASMVTTT